MSDHVIIDAAARFAKKPLPPNIDPLWTRTPEETRAMFAPSVKALPFVSSEWANDYWPESMWADVPTNNHLADRERGRHFAIGARSIEFARQVSKRTGGAKRRAGMARGRCLPPFMATWRCWRISSLANAVAPGRRPPDITPRRGATHAPRRLSCTIAAKQTPPGQHGGFFLL